MHSCLDEQQCALMLKYSSPIIATRNKRCTKHRPPPPPPPTLPQTTHNLEVCSRVREAVPELPELSLYCLDVHHAHLVGRLLLQSISMRLTPAAQQLLQVCTQQLFVQHDSRQEMRGQ